MAGKYGSYSTGYDQNGSCLEAPSLLAAGILGTAATAFLAGVVAARSSSSGEEDFFPFRPWLSAELRREEAGLDVCICDWLWLLAGCVRWRCGFTVQSWRF